MIHAWSFLSIEDDQRSHQGNLGYQDVLGERYVWDSTVPNSKSVKQQDVLLLRDKNWVYGWGTIDEISTYDTTKLRLRCPVCGNTQFDLRKTRSPKYRCGPIGHEFDNPNEESLEVTAYVADYRNSWRPIDKPMPVSEVRSAYLNQSQQQSIRPMSVELVRDLLSKWVDLADRWWESGSSVLPGGHTLGLRKSRIGQAGFRNRLFARFGSNCAITGPQPAEVLEAAHLYRYADDPRHDDLGGLLLRRDLHALFDRDLLTISPTAWTVQLAPRIRMCSDYAALHGQPLQLSADLHPTVHYLNQHHSNSTASWTARSPQRL